MNRFSLAPVKEWFGYTRRERRASFILLMLILCVSGMRYIIPSVDAETVFLPLDAGDTINKYLSGMESRKAATSSRSAVSRPQRPLLDLNKCDSASLEALPGIGPVLSARIIRYRNLLGGYASVNQLKEVYGLPEETFDMISGRLYADSMAVRKINVNSADYRELIRFPYFERYDVASILKYRELQGRINKFNELIDNKLIAPEKAGKIRPYLGY